MLLKEIKYSVSLQTGASVMGKCYMRMCFFQRRRVSSID
jgi:hypothetical protein